MAHANTVGVGAAGGRAEYLELMMSRPLARTALAIGAVVATLGMSACGGDSQAAGVVPAEVCLCYFPNLTHATAIVADKEGFFKGLLGATKLKVSTINAGPAAIEA